MNIEKNCVAHYCPDCDKKLYPQGWKMSLIMAGIICLPLVIVLLLSLWQSTKLDPPYCYKTIQYNDIAKRVFVNCPK